MRVKIALEISDQAPQPQLVIDYLEDMLRCNRYIKWFTIRPKRYRKIGKRKPKK